MKALSLTECRVCGPVLPVGTAKGHGILTSMRVLKFIVEKHPDGYIAYPLVLRGVVVGQGDSYETALADARSAAQFHIDTFGDEAWEDDGDVEAAYVAEASVAAR